MYETEARPVIFAYWRRVIFQQLKLWFSTIRKAKRPLQFLWGLKKLRTKARHQAKTATISVSFMYKETQTVLENN
jgi:hypothetical protein